MKLSGSLFITTCIVLASAGLAFANTFTVTNTNDAGAGSLRQSILDSNASVGTKDTITFNIPGTGVHTIVPNSELPSITDPVVIDATTQGNSATPLIELDGTNVGGYDSGFQISGGDSTIKGFAINRFSRDGIYVINNGGNIIQGNFIGTNPAGTVSLPNREFGVFVDGPPDNLIGGTTSDARNLVSGTIIFSGVAIGGATATNNRVEGNYIGTDVTGTIALGNSENGVYVGNTSGVPGSPSNCTVGGTDPGAGNLISGNNGNGVELYGPNASGNQVLGNLIGTNAAGTAAIPNGGDGVNIGDAQGHTVGGTAPEARNIISGNNLAGVHLLAYGDGPVTANNLVEGNYIGTDVTGTAAVANAGPGVLIKEASSNTIGGPAVGAGNLISGNADDGIFISNPASTDNLIQGNLIGTKANGTASLGNGNDGIDFSSSDPASNNTVGGSADGARNVIAFNGARGVFVSGGAGNAILANSIFSNAALGIDIGDAGITPNDTGDSDTGPNNLQNFPVLTSATLGGGQTTIEGNLNSVANTTYGLEFFASAAADPSGNGEGQTFLGSQDVTTDGSGDVALTAVLPLLPPTGQTVISATATDPIGNTSEFSNTVVAAVTAGQLLNISTRLAVLTDDNVLIGGFIILGPGPKQVIVRAIGPSLGNFGVPDFLTNPVLELHHPSGSITTNDNWKDTQQTEIEATGLAPSDDLESAIVELLEPGAYTAIVRGVAGGTGVGLVEAYDLAAAAGTTANISTRGFVDTGDNVMIGGFIVGSGGGGDATVLVRAIGPSLIARGVPGALADPTLELHDGSGNVLATDDNWKDTQQGEIEATGLQPTDDLESAILSTLVPGAYTAIVRGALDTTGVGLVEVYHLQ